MALLSIIEVFDLEDVFFFFLGSNGDTCHGRVLALSPSLFTTVLRTFLVVLILFLVGGRYLLPTKYVSKEDVDRLILSKVFIFFFRWSVPSETLGINLSSV